MRELWVIESKFVEFSDWCIVPWIHTDERDYTCIMMSESIGKEVIDSITKYLKRENITHIEYRLVKYVPDSI